MIKKIALVDKDIDYCNSLKRELEKINNDIQIYIYQNLNEWRHNNKYNNFALTLVDEKIKTKNLEYVILTEKLNNPNGLFKYKKAEDILEVILKRLDSTNNYANDYIDEDFKENVFFYDVSKSKKTDKCITKFIEILSSCKKSFVFDFNMFDNNDTDEGMDIVGALYNNSVLKDSSFYTKLKTIKENIYSFYPLRNVIEYINVTKEEVIKIYKKISEFNFEKIFVRHSGNIDDKVLSIIDRAKTFYIIYDYEDFSMKNKIKKFMERYCKIKNLETKVYDFATDDNEKKELMKINNMVACC